MTEAKITVPFGKEGYKQMLTAGNPGKAFGLILNQVSAEMTKQGYGKIAIGRAYFEDALDYQIKAKMAEAVQRRKKFNRVPKFLEFSVSVPRVE